MTKVEDENRLRALAAEVSLALGWEVEKKAREYRHYIEIVDPGTPGRIGFWLGSGKDLVEVTGRFPEDTDAHGHAIWSMPYGKKTPSINVSLWKKTGEQIASDIRRRLFPEYEPLLEEALKRVKEHREYEKETEGAGERLAKLVGGKWNPKNGEVNLYHSRELPEHLGDIKVSGEQVTFERFRTTVPEAEAMLKALITARRVGR